jgi:hypothetical protein
MPKFNVGDWVEVTGFVVPAYMRQGQIIRVIAHPDLPEGLDEYEVQFGINTALLYETQLRTHRVSDDD